jgi:hypothetical protein
MAGLVVLGSGIALLALFWAWVAGSEPYDAGETCAAALGQAPSCSPSTVPSPDLPETESARPLAPPADPNGQLPISTTQGPARRHGRGQWISARQRHLCWPLWSARLRTAER